METNKIYQGDCLELMKQIEDKSVDLILCDLPYGTSGNKWDKKLNIDILFRFYKKVIKNNGAIILMSNEPYTAELIISNLDIFKYKLIWSKVKSSCFFNAKKRPLQCYEEIIVFSFAGCTNGSKILIKYNPIMAIRDNIRKTKDSKCNFKDPKYQSKNKDKVLFGNVYTHRFPTDILVFSNANHKNILHPTQKPVALFEYLIKTYTNEGDLVLDNCIGSGTTAIACIKTNRRFIGMELEQKYVDIANKRIEEVKQEAMQSEQ